MTTHVDRWRRVARLRLLLRDLVVLATFVPGVRWLLARIYDVATLALTRALIARPYVREVGLTGSLAAGDGVLGASDIDLVVLADGAPDQRAKREVRRLFARARRVFPLVGETDERVGNLLFGADLTRNPLAAVYSCRRKAGSLRVLARAPRGGTDVASDPTSDPFTPVEVVAEITLQLQAIATQTLAGALNLYFWKSKIRVLENLLRRSSGTAGACAPSFDAAQSALLRALHETPSRTLYFRRDAVHDACAWTIVRDLVAALAAVHRLDEIECDAVDFRATAARQATLAPSALPPGLRPHAFASRPDDFGGDSVLEAPVLPHLLLEATDAHWATFRAALDATRASAAAGLVLLWLGGFVFQLHRDRCRGVFTPHDRPWLFPDRFPAPGKLRVARPFLDRLLAERDLDLAYLRDAFYWREVAPDAAGDRERHSDSLRYFEDRQRTVSGFAFIHAARALTHGALASYGARDHVLADAVVNGGAASAMLAQLRRYARALDGGTLARDAGALPPGLLRAARRHFADVLHGRPITGCHDAGTRLVLSLCVCTRNRAALLDELLASVVAQTRRPDEVLIVDNASTDDTAAVAARFAARLPLRHVVDHGDTIAKVRNRALSEAAGDVVCFTDDDCILHPEWLHFVEESFLLEDEIAIVGGRVFHHEEGPSLVDGFHRAYLGVRL
jgi:predicted nucleotidyltransferase